MRFEWHVEKSDIEAIQNIVAQQQRKTIVIDRMDRNVNGVLPEINKDEIWQTQMMCLLTSQQRSGRNQPVSNLLDENPFRLSYQKCKDANDVEEFVRTTLDDFGGIRFINNIAKCAAVNFRKLEEGGWEELLTWMEQLRTQRMQPPNPLHYQLERQSALYMQKYKGLGPKQSRNFWQALGLTRYEFVLDSRMQRWIREMGFPKWLSAKALSDEDYYCFISDILRGLCIKAGTLPCILDAAVFANYERSNE